MHRGEWQFWTAEPRVHEAVRKGLEWQRAWKDTCQSCTPQGVYSYWFCQQSVRQLCGVEGSERRAATHGLLAQILRRTDQDCGTSEWSHEIKTETRSEQKRRKRKTKLDFFSPHLMNVTDWFRRIKEPKARGTFLFFNKLHKKTTQVLV